MIEVLWIALAVVLGILGGNGAVYVFNRIPASWLCDYGEVPKEDKLQRQRITSTPWKVIFSCLLIACGVYLASRDPLFALASVFVFWILILISIADAKYMIVPDQLCILLALCSLGFINYHGKPLDMLYGALMGFGVMFLVAVISKLITKKEGLGMGDVKLMAALGFILGLKGIVICIIGMSILSAMAFAVLMAWGKLKRTDYQPLAPYISAAAAIYILVLWPIG